MPATIHIRNLFAGMARSYDDQFKEPGLVGNSGNRVGNKF